MSPMSHPESEDPHVKMTGVLMTNFLMTDVNTESPLYHPRVTDMGLSGTEVLKSKKP